ncbi:hypothetical protein [Oenococcus sicerae]|uniref:hypothetical protein n=1 Tax=Oenococcus sicerae TaxID=2203724 RepID=UPI0039EAB151
MASKKIICARCGKEFQKINGEYAKLNFTVFDVGDFGSVGLQYKSKQLCNDCTRKFEKFMEQRKRANNEVIK